MSASVISYTLATLAGEIGAELQGDPECLISGLNTLQDAVAGQLSFLANPAYQKYLSSTAASAVIIHPAQTAGFTGNKLVLSNPYLGYARASSLFAPATPAAGVIHPSAEVKGASIAATASVGANAVIEAGAILGDNVIVGPGCFVGADSSIGSGSRLHANVTLYHGVSIGRGCVLHSGCVIGADGFGFAPAADGWIKIHQLGGVVIGDRVEIGAGTTIDRGALGNTVIGNGVILDNQVQIAHNVQVGDNTAIAGCAAIAGSTRVGRNCTIAGGAGLVGHIDLVDGVHISAMSIVTKSITRAGSYSSGTGMDKTSVWRKNAARFAQLDTLARRLVALERSADQQPLDDQSTDD